MTGRLLLLLLILTSFLALPAAAAGRRVIFVDNSRDGEGDGSYERPFKRLSSAQTAGSYNGGEVIYVAEGSAPYDESITLRRGQYFIGAAYGLETLRTDLRMELDAPIVAAVQGPGPTIRGTVTVAGDNLVAGFTVATAGPAAISASGAAGQVTIRNTYVRTSNRAMGIVLSGVDHPVTIAGGGLEATAEGNGIAIWGGNGEVTFDGFAVGGNFANAIDVRGRTRGAVTFRGRAAIKIADATQPAVTIANCAGRVEIAVPLQITARAPGLSITQSTAKISGGSSWIATTDATALEIRDANVEAAFVSVSAVGLEGGRLREGIVVDKLRGTLVISGENERPASGGTIRNARLHGIAVTQSSNVRIAHMVLTDDGGGDRAKCDEQIESKTNLHCRAALYLRHVARSEFSNVTVSGGKQIGLNANNLEDVVFGGLEIRGVGDDAAEAAAVIDEVRGNVRFNRCVFEDAAGGAIVVAQQFNAGRMIFDRCTIGAAGRPVAAPYLLTFRSSAAGRLDIEVRNADVHDNAGSAVRAEAAGRSVLRLAFVDSHVQRFGRTAIEVFAREQAQTSLSFERADVMTPAVVDRPAVTVAASDGASACVAVVHSRVYVAAAVAPIRLTGTPNARLGVVRDTTGGPAIDAPAGAAALSACP
ncbi:MAG: right-handed parallel beta-helix repeat-containing protein [Acidobacteriota bacterium]